MTERSILTLMDRLLFEQFGDETWSAWRALLSALFALPMTDAELRVYTTLTGRAAVPRAQAREVWAICGRRAGKSMIAAVIGHGFPVFSGFRGGKGVATTMGALLGVMPAAMAVGLLVWLSLFLSLRYVSLASIGFGVSLPVTVWIGELLSEGEGRYVKVAFSAALAVWILVRHHSNVSRLLAGEEDKQVGLSKKTQPQDSSSVIRPQ